MINTHSRGHDYGVRHLHASQTASLCDVVASAIANEGIAVSLSAGELIALGAVYVDGGRVQNSDVLVRAGSLLRIHMQPRRYPRLETINARVIADLGDFIVFDKPAGVPVHAMVDNARENILSELEAALARRCYITHRLDIETSGLLLIALTPKAQTTLNQQLQAKLIRRGYLAFTQAPVQPAAYVHYMQDAPTAPKIIFDDGAPKRLRCELSVRSCQPASRDELERYWMIESLPDTPLYALEVELATGRTQQIRAQLAHLGAAIVGDHAYNNNNYLRDRLTMRRAIGLRAQTLDLPGGLRFKSEPGRS